MKTPENVKTVYGFGSRSEFVEIDFEKFIAMVYKKGYSKADVCKAINVGTTYFNDVQRRVGHKCNAKVFDAACKFLKVRPSYYIVKSGLKKEMPKKNPVEAVKSGKTHKEETIKDATNKIVDAPLVINLKSKSEFEELIQVQKEIRDALRDLVKELTYEPPKPQKPKAYLSQEKKKEEEVKKNAV